MAKQEEIVLALDTGALIAAERDERTQAIIQEWSRRGATIIIPSVVLAEVMRGGPRDAPANRIVKAIDAVASVEETIARAAGAMLERSGGSASETIDALVVATAQRHGAKNIVTSDPKDIERLSSGRIKAIAI